MSEYHKIQTVFKRDMSNPRKTLIEGEWARPEFEYLQDNQWVFTEKVDGMNIRVICKGGGITFGGRTDTAQVPVPLLERLKARFFPLAYQINTLFPDGVIFYGEGYGAKIQKGGGKYRLDQDFVLFDVRVDKWWLYRNEVEDIAVALGIDVVPIVGVGTLCTAVDLVKSGLNSAWGDFQAEGIVARPAMELCTRGGDRVITKIKHRDFALLPTVN